MKRMLLTFVLTITTLPLLNHKAHAEDPVPPLAIKRAPDKNGHCIDVYAEYPEKFMGLPAAHPTLTGPYFDGFYIAANIASVKSDTAPGQLNSFFCLSEKALEYTYLTLRYGTRQADGNWSPDSIIMEYNRLNEVLAESDAAAKAQ
ncbi:MAG: hypothetical protein IPH06_01755 [Alphaproteobacteria bacterium]|jgi:hypothetical protein|nr:hypothetical protein [Alphaproteobacteria bacterium]QQS56779.1 MAG: hypothetical protein IPN28_11010 [Alphaproteobacteria bacterium]